MPLRFSVLSLKFRIFVFLVLASLLHEISPADALPASLHYFLLRSESECTSEKARGQSNIFGAIEENVPSRLRPPREHCIDCRNTVFRRVDAGDSAKSATAENILEERLGGFSTESAQEMQKGSRGIWVKLREGGIVPEKSGNFGGDRCVAIERGEVMFTFLLWCILFVVCWPLALVALVVYPIVWLMLPFRIVGVAVRGVLEVIFSAITLPFRLLAAPFRV